MFAVKDVNKIILGSFLRVSVQVPHQHVNVKEVALEQPEEGSVILTLLLKLYDSFSQFWLLLFNNVLIHLF